VSTHPSVSPDEIRASLETLLGRFDAEYYRAVDAERRFPTELFDAVAQAGYFGTFIPESYGGTELGPRVAAALVEAINRAGGDAGPINAQMSICRALVLHGTDAQKARVLPGVAEGSVRCLTVAATEPGSGAHMTELKSRARRDGDDWVLSASKVFISFAAHTRFMLLLAQVEDAGPTLFLLDVEEAGERLQLHPLDLIAHRMTSSLFLDDLRVSDDARVGPPGRGLACLMDGFVIRRLLAASEAIGNARFLLDRSLEHVKMREVKGRAVGSHQGVQYPLVQAYMKVEAADALRREGLDKAERGDADAAPRSAMAKVMASEAAWETTRAALTAFGGWGLAADYDVERKLREGTVYVFNNLLMNLIADKALGLPSE
jgi:acyl-CoA dehydrogenase